MTLRHPTSTRTDTRFPYTPCFRSEQYPKAVPAWQPLKLYYHHGYNRPRTVAIHEALVAAGLDSPWAERLEQWKPNPEHDARITTKVPCGEIFATRVQALLAHATHLDLDGHWLAVPLPLPPVLWPSQ